MWDKIKFTSICLLCRVITIATGLFPVLIGFIAFRSLQIVVSIDASLIVALSITLILFRIVKTPIMKSMKDLLSDEELEATRSPYKLFARMLFGETASNFIYFTMKYFDIIIHLIIFIVIVVVNLANHVPGIELFRDYAYSINVSFIIYLAYLRLEKALSDLKEMN